MKLWVGIGIIVLLVGSATLIAKNRNSAPSPQMPVTIETPSPQEATAATPKLNFRAAADYSKQLGGSGVLVLQNDRIIFEEYQNSASASTATHIFSATKGFWGPVIAKMIEDGWLQGYDQKISDILTEWKGTNKENITIRQAMQLASGFETGVRDFHGPDSGSTGGAADNYAFAVRELELRNTPGTGFAYGPANFYVMGALMQRLIDERDGTYKDPLDYLQKNFFDKMGISYADWKRDPSGNPHLPNGAYVTPRNLAKWGQFLLQRGSWNGSELVRRDLIDALYQPSPTNPGYGLFIWLNRPGGQGVTRMEKAPRGSAAGFFYPHGYPDMIVTAGAGINRMYMIPSLNMVIVRQTLGDNSKFEDDVFLEKLFGTAS